MKIRMIIGAFFMNLIISGQVLMASEKEINTVLDGFHVAASKADFDGYFGKFAEDGVFLGTDATERWTLSEFKAFVKPYFSKGKGWTYKATKRNVTMSSVKGVAFFDELLHNEHYGTCRGSGVLIKTKDGWKVSQYNLSIPMPNALAKSFVEQIKKHEEKSQSKSKSEADSKSNSKSNSKSSSK